MANENDVSLHLKTTGDASGAEKVEKAVEEVKDSAKAAAATHRELAASLSDQELRDYAAQMDGLTEAEREQWMQSKEVTAVLDEMAERRRKVSDAATTEASALKAVGAVQSDLKDGIQQTGEAAQQASADVLQLTEAEQAMVAEAKKAAQELANQDLATVKAARAAKEQAESIRQVESATRAMVAMEVAQHLQSLISQMRSTAEEGTDMAHVLDQAGTSLGVFQAGIGTFIATGNPLLGVLAGIAGGAGGVVSAFKEMTAAQKAAEQAERQYADMVVSSANAVREARQSYMREQRTAFIQKVYADENAELEKQVGLIRQINELRSAKNDLEVSLAQSSVTRARNEGGDVGLAEMQLLATRLRTELDNLTQQVTESRAAADAAAEAASKARILANDAANNNPAEIDRLEAAAKAAQDKAAQAISQADLDASKFIITKTKLLDQFDTELSSLESQTSAALSPAAKAVGDKIYKSIQSSYAEIGNAIPTVTGEAAEPVKAKAQDVKTGLDQERKSTVTQIESLAPKAEHTGMVTDAVKKVETALVERDNAEIQAFNSFAATVSAGFSSIVSAYQQQQQQIAGILTRLR